MHCMMGIAKTLVRQAMELKDEGNAYFREAAWHDALQSYLAGLARLPPRVSRASRKGKEKESEEDGEASDSNGDTAQSLDVVDERTRPEIECALMRSVLNGNVAACHVKMVRQQDSPHQAFGTYALLFRTIIRKLSTHAQKVRCSGLTLR